MAFSLRGDGHQHKHGFIRQLGNPRGRHPIDFTINPHCDDIDAIGQGAEDKILRLTIKKSGRFTSSIPDLKPGTPVKCGGPFGVFCRDVDEKGEILMIAGGVGITPFLSVLRHFRNIRAWNRVRLFCTNKTREEAFAADELREMTKDLNLKVVHTLSREKETDKYFQADTPEVVYVPGYATRELLGRHIDSPNTSFYLCGPPKMQDFVLGELEACGVDRTSVEIENFSYDSGKV